MNRRFRELAADVRIGSGPAAADVAAASAVEQITARSSEEAVVAPATEQPVWTPVPTDHVSADTAACDVGAYAADDQVGAAPPEQGVVASATADDVSACGPGERLGRGGADDIVPRITLETSALDLLHLALQDVVAEEAAVRARIGAGDVRVVVEVDEAVV